MTDYCYLVLVRHGQSEWNLENKFTGWVDVDLTQKGIEEALNAGRKLKEKNIKFNLAFTSVLKRANKTLEIILKELAQENLQTQKDQALNERHYGDLQGKDKAQTAEQFGEEQVKIWRRSYDIAPPNGESLKNTAERTLPYFDEKIMPELLAGKNIIIAAHGNSLRSIAMKLDKLTKEQVLEFEIPTATPLIYKLNTKTGEFTNQGFLK